MNETTLISVEEYLTTSYDPDVEFVDGVIVERNVGDWLHSLVQRNIIFHLRLQYPEIYAVPELRLQTTETRYRLPDVCVLLTAPTTDYLLEAAFVAVEILSKDDAMTVVLEKLEEYERKGVPNIWLVDPRRRKMYTFRLGDLQIAENALTTADGSIQWQDADVFRT